jgi:hypothetical protein
MHCRALAESSASMHLNEEDPAHRPTNQLEVGEGDRKKAGIEFEQVWRILEDCKGRGEETKASIHYYTGNTNRVAAYD